jgi:pyruvate dehydrogenase phosphatase
MWRHAWKPVAAVVVVGTPPAYLYYRHYVKDKTFELPVKVQSPDGKSEMATRTFPLLPLTVLEARIREHATFQFHSRPGGIVWKQATAALASNDPIEDAHASQIVERDPSDPSYPGDYLFFAVMDGHGGYETSRLLSRVLIKAVALELSYLNNPPPLAKPSYLGSARALLWPFTSQTVTYPLDADPQKVSLAIQHAFTKLDDELLAAPLRILANNLDEESRKKNVIPDLSHHPLALATMLPAISGQRLLMTFLHI